MTADGAQRFESAAGKARAYFILAGFIAVAGLLVTNSAVQAVVAGESADRNGEVVVARVDELVQRESVRGRGEPTFQAQIAFETLSGEQVATALPDSLGAPDYRVGDLVEIRYDSEDPQNVLLNEGNALLVPYVGLYAGIACIAAAAVLGGCGLRWRVRSSGMKN